MPVTQRVSVAEGIGLRALRWDGGGKPPFLLVHGLASNCRTWEAVAERLARQGHPVAAVDLRGHGQSDKPEGGYDFATFTTDLRMVITSLGLERPIVAGQSLGGNLVVELAHRSPELMAGVVGVDGGAIELARRWPRWEDCEEALAPPRLEGRAATEVERWIRDAHPDWSDAGLAATLANLEVLADGTVRPWLSRDRHLRLLRALWEHHPSTILPALAVPVLLVLAGSGDGNGTPTGPTVRVERLAGDHDLHVQQPDVIARLLAGFARVGHGRS